MPVNLLQTTISAALRTVADSHDERCPPMMPQGCHSDSGYTHQPRGFYAQLIYGESFEGDLPVDTTLNNATGPTAMPTQAPTAAFKRLPPLGRPGLGLRHCSYELFATRTEDKDDFRWLEVPAINGANGGISFKSRNYPTHFICPPVKILHRVHF